MYCPRSDNRSAKGQILLIFVKMIFRTITTRLPDLDYTRLNLNDQDQVNRTEKDRKDLIAKAVMNTDLDSEVKFRLEMKDCKFRSVKWASHIGGHLQITF